VVESAPADAQPGRVESSTSQERLFLYRLTRSYDVARTHQLSGSSDMYLCTRTDSPMPRPRPTCCRTGGRLSPLDGCAPI
jgi:hypothetical protein